MSSPAKLTDTQRAIAGARVRSPVVWIAGWRETKTLKPIDNVSLREDDELPGRNDSERKSGLESA